MSTIVTRAGKGSPLTHNEVDANFNNLNSDKYQSGNNASFGTLTASGAVTFSSTVVMSGSTTANTFSSSGVTISGGSINGTAIGGSTAAAGKFTTLEATGVSTFSAGTVSAPAITTSGDTNTGIFFPAADTIAFTEGGVESMRIDSSGNVGIGTTSVTSGFKFEVKGSIPAIFNADSTANTATYGGVVFYRPTSTANNGNGFTFRLNNSSSAVAEYAYIGGLIETNTASSESGSIVFSPTSAGSRTERMRISSGGNVSIGTTAITGLLTVASSSNDANSSLAGSGIVVGSTIGIRERGNSNGISGTTYASQIYQGASGGGHLEIYNVSTGYGLVFGTETTERMRITSAGNVGIGTASPNSLLEIKAGSQNTPNFRIYSTYNSAASSYGIDFYRDTDSGTNLAVAYTKAARTGGNDTGLVFGTSTVPGTVAERMRITSGGDVGIGTSSPSTVLQVTKNQNANTTISVTNSDTTNTSSRARFQATSGTVNLDITAIQSLGGYIGTASNHNLELLTNGNGRVIIDTSGNVGIGVTPTSPVYSLWRVLQIGNSNSSGILFGRTDSDKSMGLMLNGYYSGTAWLYRNTGAAASIEIGDDVISFKNAPSGTAGNALTLSERMRIDSNGNVLVGTTTANGTLSLLNAQSTAANNTTTGSIFSALSPTSGIFMRNKGNNAGISGVTYPTQLFTDSGAGHFEIYNIASAYGLVFGTNATERMRITSGGDVGIGTSSPLAKLDVRSASATVGSGSGNISVFSTDSQGIDLGGTLVLGGNADTQIAFGSIAGRKENSTSNNRSGYLQFSTYINGTGNVERMRITSVGEVLIGTTTGVSALATTSASVSGIGFGENGNHATFTRFQGVPVYINRTGNDGTLIAFMQAGTQEGDISVSGSTVSYNGGHLSRYAQTTAPKDDGLLKGTVLSNLDEMNEYVDAEGNQVANEQLNKVKVSDVEGDVNVAGVFVNWTYDEAHNVDEINMAMTGDMIIRIAEGVVVQKGDLLMSAGDGTAKLQGDDIVRSKTIAKVTSNHVTCTYADGSYCVPCVLMAC